MYGTKKTTEKFLLFLFAHNENREIGKSLIHNCLKKIKYLWISLTKEVKHRQRKYVMTEINRRYKEMENTLPVHGSAGLILSKWPSFPKHYKDSMKCL